MNPLGLQELDHRLTLLPRHFQGRGRGLVRVGRAAERDFQIDRVRPASSAAPSVILRIDIKKSWILQRRASGFLFHAEPHQGLDGDSVQMQASIRVELRWIESCRLNRRSWLWGPL